MDNFFLKWSVQVQYNCIIRIFHALQLYCVIVSGEAVLSASAHSPTLLDSVHSDWRFINHLLTKKSGKTGQQGSAPNPAAKLTAP